MELPEVLIKKLKSDGSFNEFAEYIIAKIDELDTVDDLYELPNEQAGEIAKVRYFAKRKLLEILSPVIGYKEASEVTEEMIEKRKKQFGLS